ncbi:MAG: selenocysteine-specific translation elongation factor [Chloroflexota bacterium]|jgi:selenocysteine-specific elongation factor|nr:selenocysteine-specific translation elongation factor [Chloroflexota bacterium]
MFTIGTSGHIDHGKSALVEALTGVNPDRLPEERQRGMTIDLGFASLTLPGGELVGIVDVPGHERFVRNMVAGVGGIDAVLLVIAADEGVMPQTREHLDIVNLLGIERGVVALTKADLVDDGDWMELVTADALELLEGTTLGEAEVIRVSATRREGLNDLLAALDRVLAGTESRSASGNPRLPVDRSFSVAGFGTVVTGTLQDGHLEIGAELEVLPGGGGTRVRGIQVYGEEVEQAEPGARTAVNIAGIAVDDVPRGTVLARPGSLSPTRLVDARVNILPHLTGPLRNGREIAFHTGTTEVRAAVRLLDSDVLNPGETGWVQIRSRSPLVVRPGDHFIIRQLSPAVTLGGGTVAASRAIRIRRHDKQAIQRLENLTGGSDVELLAATLEPVGSLGRDELAGRSGLTEAEFAAALATALAEGRVAAVGSKYFGRGELDRLRAQIDSALVGFHRANPLRPGMPRAELRSQTGLSVEAFGEILSGLDAERRIRAGEAFVAQIDHAPEFTPATEAAAKALLARLSGAGLEVPPLLELASEAGVGEDVLQALEDAGRLIRVAANIAYESVAYADLVEQVSVLIGERGRLDVAGLRDHFGSSRRYCLALLEHLDSTGVTRRVGDARVLRKRG